MSGNKCLFPGLRVPEPPEELRRRVLGRARQTLETGPRHDLWTRVWQSRQARLAWGTSVLALTVCHVVVPLGDAEPGREPPTLTRNESDHHEELDVIANLPRLSLDARPPAAAPLTTEETEADPDTAAPPEVSEENAS